MDGARGRDFAGEGGELVGDDANLTGTVAVWQAEDFGWRLILVPGTEWAVLGEGRQFPRGTVHDQLLRTLGAFGGDDDPFLGEEILSQFWHSAGSLPDL